MCVCACTVCCPPLTLPPPNRRTKSTECAVRNDAFHGEIKENCILRKAVKFTGRRGRAARSSFSGFPLWTSPPGCILRPSKTCCARRRWGAANKRAYFVMMLWCNYVDVLRMLFVLKEMVILTDTALRHTRTHTCCAHLLKPIWCRVHLALYVHACFCFNKNTFTRSVWFQNRCLLTVLVWPSLLYILMKSI